MKKLLFIIPLLLLSCKKEVVLQPINKNVEPLELVTNYQTKITSLTEQSENSFGMITFNISNDKELILSRYYFENFKKQDDSTFIQLKKMSEEQNPIYVTGYFPNSEKKEFTVISASEKPKSYSKKFDSAAVEFKNYAVNLIETKAKPKRNIKEAELVPDEQMILEKIPSSITYDWMAKRFNAKNW